MTVPLVPWWLSTPQSELKSPGWLLPTGAVVKLGPGFWASELQNKSDAIYNDSFNVGYHNILGNKYLWGFALPITVARGQNIKLTGNWWSPGGAISMNINYDDTMYAAMKKQEIIVTRTGTSSWGAPETVSTTIPLFDSAYRLGTMSGLTPSDFGYSNTFGTGTGLVGVVYLNKSDGRVYVVITCGWARSGLAGTGTGTEEHLWISRCPAPKPGDHNGTSFTLKVEEV